MKRIIWAIAAVFSIQVAFQLLMTAERSDADYAALQTPLLQPVEAYKLPAASDDDLYIPDEFTVAPMVIRPHTAVLAVNSKTAATTVPNRVVAEKAEPHEKAPFKPVIIPYDRSGALTEAAAFTGGSKARVTTDKRLADDRPLIAKIVTKPYDWLKTVASKLH